jgi:hypothetical protein
VKRARLILSSQAQRHKLAFLTEEALRLCTLPGEEEGRLYYFRRLRVTDLPEDGDRRAWLNAFQQAMQEQAGQAVHGAQPRTAAADSVYFRTEQEACECLLMLYAARRTPVEWYWPRISRKPQGASAPEHVVGVIETLLQTAAGWSAVAAAFFSLTRQSDITNLLRMLPEQVIVKWIQEMGADLSAPARPIHFSTATVATIQAALATTGPDSPAMLWLAALAVILLQPSSLEAQSAVRIARASLHDFIGGAPLSSTKSSAEQTITPAIPGSGPTPVSNSATTAMAKEQSERFDDNTATPAVNANIGPAESAKELCFGERTAAAGLYFLLNALRRLELGEQQYSLLFIARLFARIAAYTGVEADDPIRIWFEAIEREDGSEEPNERLLRIWLIKLRKWCWRNGRLSLRDIVQRPGYITLTRTHLDVTLSIDSADIRIRRTGLDLDPGWLPWFGRVVHFHYHYRGELHG